MSSTLLLLLLPPPLLLPRLLLLRLPLLLLLLAGGPATQMPSAFAGSADLYLAPPASTVVSGCTESSHVCTI
jgi:hypothetical protein